MVANLIQIMLIGAVDYTCFCLRNADIIADPGRQAVIFANIAIVELYATRGLSCSSFPFLSFLLRCEFLLFV